ncbi:hypothetical protein IAR50_007315 [Cryptococcus sp. DSM 104548]
MRATPDTTPLNLTPSLSHTLPPTHSARTYTPTPRANGLGQRIMPAGYERWFKQWRGMTIKKVGSGGWCCDEFELERQESEYHVLRLSLGLPFPAAVFKALNMPNGYGQPRVLDVGTGTGVWAIDLADMLPHAEVIGLDTAPIQRQFAPQNCDFDISSASSLPYSPSSFTLINLSRPSSLPAHPWLRTIGDLNAFYGLLRPGGWVGVGDWHRRPFVRYSPQQSSSGRGDGEEEVLVGTAAWYDAYDKSLRAMGHLFDMDRLEAKLLSTEYDRREVIIPLGAHEGRRESLGKLQLVNMRAFVESARYVLSRHGRYSDAEINVLSGTYLQELESSKMYMRYRSLWIMKPSFG